VSVGVVVGAGGGIGSACARALDGSCDVMVLVGRSEHSLGKTAASLSGATSIVVADIATDKGREEIGRTVEETNSEVAWVVLASGVPLRGPLMRLAPDDIAQTFLVNLVGPALLIRRLLECRWLPNSSIIAIGSISASRALPNRSVYSGSKAGLEHLCHSLAAEVAPLGIRVNVVSPGVVETEFVAGDREALDAWVTSRVPQKRAGSPEDISNVVRYLALEASLYVTGARIAVDGGAETLS
jgi:NAD(P)-dependent dehydrogenase (short-subunit alcohol dehydrogenase family)